MILRTNLLLNTRNNVKNVNKTNSSDAKRRAADLQPYDMRIERPQQKLVRTVAIPEQLRSILREVAGRIAARDEEAMVPSDDLMQADAVYGGLLEEGGSEYAFTFFPGPGTSPKWELILTVADMEAIAMGRKNELQLWGCASDGCHSLFADPGTTCSYCDYVDESPKLPPRLYAYKMRWAREFFALNPEAKGFHLREVVQQNPEVAKLYVDFTNSEIATLMEQDRKS